MTADLPDFRGEMPPRTKRDVDCEQCCVCRSPALLLNRPCAGCGEPICRICAAVHFIKCKR